MSNWDDEDFELPSAGGGGVNVPNTWEGEDEDVKEAWDADDSGDAKAKNEQGLDHHEGEGVVKKKKTLQEKIKEREDRQRELMQKKAEAERNYTEAEKRQMQEESDLAIAIDTLGVANLDASQGLLEKFDPKTLEDFVEFRFQLSNKLLKFKESPHYYLFVEDLFRELGSCLKSDDTRKLSTILLAMSNEKMKREKDGKKTKNKSKKQLKQVGSAINDHNGYGGEDAEAFDDPIADEYDDFI